MSHEVQDELTEDEVKSDYKDYADVTDHQYEQYDEQFDEMNPMYENYQGLSDNEDDQLDVDYLKNTIKVEKAFETFNVEFREQQTAVLTSFLDIYKQPDSFPLLQFVCGPPSSGADYTIKTMLKHFHKATENFEYFTIKKSSVIDFKGFLKTTARELHNLLHHKYKASLSKVFESELKGKSHKRKAATKKSLTANAKSGLDSRAMESFSNFRDYVHNLLLFFNSIADDKEHTSIYIHLQEYDLFQQVDYHTLSRMVKIFEGLSG